MEKEKIQKQVETTKPKPVTSTPYTYTMNP